VPKSDGIRTGCGGGEGEEEELDIPLSKRQRNETGNAFSSSSASGKKLRIPRNPEGRVDTSADTLLKLKIEERFNAEFLSRGADEEWKYFEFKSSRMARAPDARAYYDKKGMVRDANSGKIYPSLSQWAKAVKGRQVSVKPVIFYNNLSLREYEEIAPKEVEEETMCEKGNRQHSQKYYI
jgi:hypothetical protein